MLQIEEPRRAPTAGSSPALWQLGFRPFYLLASGFSALSIVLWALQFSGWLGHAYLQGPLWHAHEMLFGFTLAVVVGFLFTAVRNWTNRPTPTGVWLMALAALWLAARALVLTPFAVAAAAANTAFPLAAAAALAIPLIGARNARNYFFVGLLLLMAGATLAFHLAQMGLLQTPAWLGIGIALDVVLFIMTVMGGRVIPMFTNNGVPGARATRQPLLEKLVLGSTLAILAADAAGLRGLPLMLLAAACGAAHLGRWALWQPWRSLRTPLVWVLHAGYLWIPLHLALRAAAEAGLLAPSAATHALTVGAVGGLVIGMMVRTARGHTGRLLRAGRADVWSFGLVLAAALARVLLPLAAPALTLHAVLISSVLWSAGFGVYAVAYWPVLTRARVDGKPG